jgi:hypothetical protein
MPHLVPRYFTSLILFSSDKIDDTITISHIGPCHVRPSDAAFAPKNQVCVPSDTPSNLNTRKGIGSAVNVVMVARLVAAPDAHTFTSYQTLPKGAAIPHRKT